MGSRSSASDEKELLNPSKILKMTRILLITGGQRSGKSQYAEQLALSLSPNPIYVATARVFDEEFRQRVALHQARRGPQWTNIEEEKELARHIFSQRVVLVDCLTLWATNFFFDLNESTEQTLLALREQLEALFAQEDVTYIFVTNELGLGGVSPNATQRRFTDLQGSLNQIVAHQADEVTLMVSGIPIRIK
jgi:bifunctional adenosylcobalamin biosynthesis protein cobP